jgi:hypothetical protein
MPPSEEARRRLDALRPDYDAVRALCGRRDELQTVEQARAAYEGLLSAESALVAGLKRRRDDLEREGERRSREAEIEEDLGPVETAWDPQARPWRAPPVPPEPPRAPARGTDGEARFQLGLLVNQFQYVWRLDEALVGRVNQLVADPNRPLGEALALLPWAVFEGPGHADGAEHLARLDEWGEALADCRGRLEAENDMLETRFRGWLGIWELWRGREGDGREAWDTFIAHKRRALGEEAGRLREAIAGLEARLGEGGGPS